MNKSQTKRRKTQKNRAQMGGYERTAMFVHKAPELNYKDNMGSVGSPVPASGYNSHIATRGGRKNNLRKSRKNKRKTNINKK